jgi:predicted alpha/beta superfamily hydrolase
MHSVTSPENKICQITLDIAIKAALPQAEQLFITGNLPELGDWDPAGNIVKETSPGRHQVTLTARAGSIIECKLTRGTWKTQAIFSCDDIPPSNLVIKVKKNKVYKVEIIDWLDQLIIESDPVEGELITITDLASSALEYQRDIQVWLPDTYDHEGPPSSVIYMHDGQNLFEPAKTFAGVDWKIDETLTELLQQQQIKNCIVVGIPNSPLRMQELDLATTEGQAYMSFITDIVKPYIDSQFNVAADAKNTMVMGSSMGGLMSLQMAIARPDVFSGAGCLSSAFSRSQNNLFAYVKKLGFLPDGLRIYLDTGEYEPPIVKDYFKMMHLLKKKGFNEGYNLMGLFDEKATHCEAAWAKRLGYPLRFLLRHENII